MTDPNKITGHFIAHWGLATGIRTRPLPGNETFAILDFARTPTRLSHLYATNGMSRHAQRGLKEGVTLRTEVYGCCREWADWLDNLLVGIATYPQDYNTCLAEGDTIEVGQPIDQRASRFTGILFAPPDPPTLGRIDGIAETVLVHQVVGILPKELAFAKQHGGHALWDILKGEGELYLDEDRASVL